MPVTASTDAPWKTPEVSLQTAATTPLLPCFETAASTFDFTELNITYTVKPTPSAAQPTGYEIKNG
jgi:hypothetical protein